MKRGLIFALMFWTSTASAWPWSSPRLPKDYLHVPLIRQATDYSCGAAALLAVLHYWQGYDAGESMLYKKLETTEKDGTDSRKILEFALAHGLNAEMREKVKIEELRVALKQGQTVILDIQAWPSSNNENGLPWEQMWEAGHYVVMVGMDSKFIYVMDPSTTARYGYIPLEELYRRWHDYEDRTGVVWKNDRLAIFIHGTKPFFDRDLRAVTRIE